MMLDRFLRYSLENGRKIAVVFLSEGKPQKKNLLVTGIHPEEETFTALLSGKKKEILFRAEDVLTADYARGDHGDLEE